jgi:hypothetical protein
MATEIVIFHVGGGSDEVGPVERVQKMFPTRLVTFEALDGQCISDAHGEAAFYVNKCPLSSGLFPPNERFAAETYGDSGITWGANTEVDRVLRLETVPLNAIWREQPDVLSLDVQGAEYAVLKGASDLLGGVLCVVSECEFEPIYDGQPLLDAQMRLLRSCGFRLMTFMNTQEWHHGPKFGLGFFTVAEAVWLRHDYERLDDAQTEKLAMIAASFGRLSYALLLLARIDGKVQNEWLRDLWEHRDNPEIRRAACAS